MQKYILTYGDWKSCIRIFQAVLVVKRTVQPIVILDPKQLSATRVLRSVGMIINSLRNHLKILDSKGETHGEILDAIYVNKFELQHDQDLAYSNLLLFGESNFYDLYDINRYLKDKGKEIEIAINEDSVSDEVFSLIKASQLLKKNNLSPTDFFKQYPSYATKLEQVKEVFNATNFPLLEITNEELLDFAKHFKFFDILKYTWNCSGASKLKKGKVISCGKCSSCKAMPIDLRINKSNFLQRLGLFS